MTALLRLFTSKAALSCVLIGVLAGGGLACAIAVLLPAVLADQALPFERLSWLVGTFVAALVLGGAIGLWLGRHLHFKAAAAGVAAAATEVAADSLRDPLLVAGAASTEARLPTQERGSGSRPSRPLGGFEHETVPAARTDTSVRLFEDSYARAIEASNAGCWEWNVASGELFLSERLRPLLGLASDAQFADRIEFLACIPFHPDDRLRVIEVVAKTVQSGADRYEVDFGVMTRSGDARWLRASGKVYRDPTGSPMRVAEVVTDVTEQRVIQEELRVSEARFRSLTELLSDWYWRQDESLRFTYLSNQAKDLTGYSGESSIGKTRWELVNMTPLSTSWPEHQAVLAARQPFRDLELCRIGTDGQPRYLSISGAPIFDKEGSFKGYHGIGRNITERKRIEEELHGRRELLELAQKAARAVAFEWRINAAAERARAPLVDLDAMLGLAPGSYDGTYETWKELVHANDRPAVLAAMQRAAETGELSVEYRVNHPNGAARWLEAKGRLSRDSESQAMRVIGFMLDVNERHEAEEELRRLERQLRQSQRLEAMGTLAGGIAHDFNNILGAVLGYGERALRDAPKDSRQRRDLDSVVTAGERGRALVDQILAFSRSCANERIPVHVERVVGEALDHLAARVPPSITVVSELRSGCATVLGDTTQVHQVLMNLATNALQAMPSGGTVRVSLESTRIDAPRLVTTGTIEAGEYVVLDVADRGTGIPPEIVDRIFDPFFTTKEVGVGTGLGLSLVHGIVMELGGAINVASTAGKGSVFTVYLPRAGDAAEANRVDMPGLPQGNRERVLVVDDEEPLMRIATETLEELGYRPMGFTSSLAALEAFRADPLAFDAVITDERMPGVTGSSLIREMRAVRPRLPLILMSGFIDSTLPVAAHEKGADEVLRKPLLMRDLADALARALHRTRFGVQ